MYTKLFFAFVLLGVALLLGTWHVVKTESFIDASGAKTDASGAVVSDKASEYIANLLNAVFPKLKFTPSTESTTAPEIEDKELVRKYLQNDMAKLLKEEVLQLRQLVPVPACSAGGVSPALAQGLETYAKPM